MSASKQFTVRIRSRDGEVLAEVPADLVEIAGRWVAVHENPLIKTGITWVVTEPATGFFIGRGDSRASALLTAIERCEEEQDRYGKDPIRTAVCLIAADRFAMGLRIIGDEIKRKERVCAEV